MFRSKRLAQARSTIFLDETLPTPPSVIRDLNKNSKKKTDKERESISKPLTAKAANEQLKWLLTVQIPSLLVQIQTANHYKQKSDDELTALRLEHASLSEELQKIQSENHYKKKTDEELAALKLKYASLSEEMQNIQKRDNEWEKIEREMCELHGDNSEM